MARAEVLIRPATDRDRLATIDTVRRAFGRDEEADLVERLLEGSGAASLIAEVGGAVAGHAMLCWLDAEIDGRPVPAMALAPVSVRPSHQGRGIGASLVEAAVATAQDLGAEAVIVVGDPRYYGRFGFSAARAAVLSSPYAGAGFLGLELVPGALSGNQGRASYPAPFDALG